MKRRQRISVKCAALMMDRLIKQSGFSKARVARKMGCTPGHLTKITSGKKVILFGEFLELCYAINRDPVEVADWLQWNWRKVWAEVEAKEQGA